MNREEAHLDQCTQEHISQAISYLDSDEWLQLFHHPDPSGINNLRIAVSTVIDAINRFAEDNNVPVKQPDPITGLVPCGGRKAMLCCTVGEGFWVACSGVSQANRYETEAFAIKAWNESMGYTAPPPSGAIGPDAGEMDPNGDEGAEL